MVRSDGLVPVVIVGVGSVPLVAADCSCVLVPLVAAGYSRVLVPLVAAGYARVLGPGVVLPFALPAFAR